MSNTEVEITTVKTEFGATEVLQFRAIHQTAKFRASGIGSTLKSVEGPSRFHWRVSGKRSHVSFGPRVTSSDYNVDSLFLRSLPFSVIV